MMTTQEFQHFVLKEFQFVRTRLEGLEGLPSAVKELQEDMKEVKQDIRVLKQDVSELKQDVGVLKNQMSFLFEKVLPTIATKDDILRLERRLIVLESAR